MNTYARLSLALLVALAAAGCRKTDNVTPTTTPSAATPATTTMPADTMPDASMPAPASTMTSPAGTNTGDAMSGGEQAADQGFLSEASRSNEDEIALTALAMEKGGANLKPVATTLNKDHTALRDKLNAASGAAAPAASAPADVASLTGKDFDARVLSLLREHHEKGIATYTAASTNTALSEDIRKLASDTLPTLKSHLEQVKSAQSKE